MRKSSKESALSRLRKDNWGSPTDRAALNQARELAHRTRVMRKCWIRLAAMQLTGSPRRFLALSSEACAILGKEIKRIYEIDHPKKRLRKAKRGCNRGA